ncbi:MAG: DMT family transporter, partial [Rhodospirillaceae bacterium]
MTPADALAVATVVFLWGFNIVVAKVGVGEISPFTLTFIRFALVALLLVPFFHPKKRHLPWIAVLALTFGVMHFGALFQAMTELDAGTTAILLQLGVPFTVLFAALLLKETVGPIRWVGIGIAFSGSAVIAGEPNLPGLWPVFLMFISMSGWALSNLVVKKLVGLHPLAMTGWLCLFTLPVLLPLVLFLEADQLHTLPDVSAMGWAALLYIAIAASIIAHSLWYGLLTRHPVTRV